MGAALGPFELQDELARGGMGIVLRGRHRGDATPVAIKVVGSAALLHDRYEDDFRAEVQATARLLHPHIVTLLEYGTVSEEQSRTTDGALPARSPYLVMELADAGSLAQHAPTDWPTLRRQLLQLLDALGHAHARGLVHRDLKPGNVLLHRGRRDLARVLLADFGIAHASDHRADRGPRLDQVIGTVSYMAPEQIEGRWRDYGPWTDLYALGIMTHQFVSGQVPFLADVPAAVLLHHLSTELPALRPRFSVPDGLAAWVRKLADKKPKARFERAADAAHALRALDSPAQLGGSTGAAAAKSDPAPPSRAGEPAAGAPPWSDPVAGPGSHAPAGSGAPPWGGPADGAPPWGPPPGPTPGGAPPWAAASEPGAAPGWGDVSGLRRKVEEPPPPPAFEELPPLPESWRREEEGRPPSLHGAGLGLYFLRAVPLVDRQPERDAVWQALREAAAEGAPRALILTGPSGTGKSRLAEWMAQRAHELGAATVLFAGHSRTASPTVGLPRMIAAHYEAVGLSGPALAERLEGCLRDEGVEDELEVGSLRELLDSALADEAAAGKSRVRFASPTERYLAVEGVLARAARRRPVVVQLDDVQWGSDALAMARHALDHLEAPVLLLITAQQEALVDADAVRLQLDELAAHPRARALRVGPLASEDTSTLVEQLLGLKGSLTDRVCRRAHGNALFAVQLVGDWVQRGVLQLTPGGFALRPGERGDIPEDLRSIWSGRLERLFRGRPEAARAVIELAAVLGLSHDEDELDAVCAAWGTPLSGELLDALARARMIERDDNGWAFVHGMLRETLVKEAEAAGRAPAMHGVCADVIAARGGRGSAERRATHLADAGREPEAIAPFLDAAEELRDGSDYARALAMLARREELMARLGLAHTDPRWGRGWVLRADVHRLEWDFEAARVWAKNALGSAEAPGWEPVRAEAELILANVSRQQGAPDEALRHLLSARELFHRLDDDDGRARTLLVMASLSRQRGDYEDAGALYARALALFELTGDGRGAANAALGLAHLSRHAKEYATAEREYERARERCEEAGYRAGIANCLMGRADVQRYQGQLEAAEEAYRRALQIQKSIGSKAVLVARLNLGLVLIERERWSEARAVFEAELPGLLATNKNAYVGWLRCVLLPCTAHAGDAEAFDPHLEAARAVANQRALVDEDMAKSAERAAQIWMERGDAERAGAARALAVELFRAVGDEARANDLER